MTEATGTRHDAAVGRSFLALGTGEAIARLVAFGATMYLARRLGADVYGTIALATAILLYLNCLTDCGIEMLGISDVARQPGELPVVLPSILVGRLVVAVVLMAAASLVGMLVMPQPEGALLASYALTLGAVAMGTQWVHIGLERPAGVGMVRTGAELLTALLIVLLVHGPGDVAAAPLAQVIGQGAGAVVLLVLIGGGAARLPARIRAGTVGSIWRRSWPLVLHALLGLAIFNSDFLFLRAFRDAASVGYYAVAYLLVSFFLNLGVSYSMGLLPVMTRLRAAPVEERRLFDSAMAQVFAVALPVAIGGSMLATPFIGLLFGDGYRPAAPALAILVWSVPFSLFRNVAQAGLIAHDRQDRMLHTVSVAAVLNFVLNLALIPFFGMMGAAVATLLTEAIRTVVVLGYSRQVGLPFTSARRFWRAIASGAVMGAVLLAAGRIPWWAAVPIGALTYGTMLTLLGGVKFRRGARPELAV